MGSFVDLMPPAGSIIEIGFGWIDDGALDDALRGAEPGLGGGAGRCAGEAAAKGGGGRVERETSGSGQAADDGMRVPAFAQA